MEELKVTIEKGVSALEVRTGEALELQHPVAISVKGNLDTVQRFLKKRIEGIDQSKATILVTKEINDISLELIIDERDYFRGIITGKLEFHEDFEEFKINTGEKRTLRSLSDFIKMHRYCFEDTETAMKLVAELRTFRGKVNKEMESKSDNVGNKKEFFEQVVESNIPAAFVLNMPIFKGGKKKKFEVEIHINPREQEMDCQLASVEAHEIIMVARDEQIDKELIEIKDIAPNIFIYEG